MSYDEATVQQVWERGRASTDFDPAQWRQDQCGAWLRRDQYGSANGPFAWKILPVKPGPGNDVDNLRPFHRENDFDRALSQAHCNLTSDRLQAYPTAQMGEPANRPA